MPKLADRRSRWLPGTPASQLPDIMMSTQAQIWLGISRRKMAALLRAGEQGKKSPQGIPWTQSALDTRIKMVKKSDVVALRDAGIGPLDAEYLPPNAGALAVALSA